MAETWTVLRLLTWCRDYFTGKNIDQPRLDAEVLLAHVLGVDRVGLYLRYDRPLSAEELGRFRELVQRRAEREPVAHLVGTKEFYGLSFLTDKRALVPRPETEVLVETVLTELPAENPQTICDVGTGAGCLVVSLLKQRPAWTAVATDCSADALALAKENAEKLGVADRLQLLSADLLVGVPGVFDAVVSNPPYVPTAECEKVMPEVSRYDPRPALDGGPDGLAVIDRLVQQTPAALRNGGLLALEIGAGQADRVLDLLQHDGRYTQVRVNDDLAGIPRVIGARKKES